MFGLYQAEHGPKAGVRCFLVKKKKTPVDDELWMARQTLANNLHRAMAKKFKDEPNRPAALEKTSEVGKSVIKRLLKPKNEKDPYPTLETLVRLAHGLGIDVFELVIDAQGQRELADREPRSNAVDRVPDARDLKRG
jgi:hypothetical protein